MNRKRRGLFSILVGLGVVSAGDFGLWLATVVAEHVFLGITMADTESMVPSLSGGARVFASPIASVGEGDVVVFTPNGNDRLCVTRRRRCGEPSGAGDQRPTQIC